MPTRWSIGGLLSDVDVPIHRGQGVIYHPKFNPPPPEVVPRLSWRTDDTPDTLARRLQVYREKTRPIYGPSPMHPPAPACHCD